MLQWRPTTVALWCSYPVGVRSVCSQIYVSLDMYGSSLGGCWTYSKWKPTEEYVIIQFKLVFPNKHVCGHGKSSLCKILNWARHIPSIKKIPCSESYSITGCTDCSKHHFDYFVSPGANHSNFLRATTKIKSPKVIRITYYTYLYV